MFSTHSISPCLPDDRRDAFGHWLSGFVDGEGSFTLNIGKHRQRGRYFFVPCALFQITIRQDDRPILEEIAGFWGCGKIGTYTKRFAKNPRHKPTCHFHVCSAADHVQRVIPHFLRYPLRAKKKADFDIWKEAVGLIVQGWQSTGRRYARWSGDRLSQFRQLRSMLRHGRDSAFVPDYQPSVIRNSPSLFD